MKIFANIFVVIIVISVPFSALFIKCPNSREKDNSLYHNFNGKIVAIGEQTAPSHNKFHAPTEYYKLLIQMQTDTTLFFEWMTTPEKYYNYKINQIVHFDYIKKDRTFHIK